MIDSFFIVIMFLVLMVLSLILIGEAIVLAIIESKFVYYLKKGV